jgi:gliding motility-associated-like protein
MLFNRIHIFFLLFFGTASAQYIATDDSRTPLQLIEDVLINSGCASVSNVSVSGGNFASSDTSYGYFNANGSNFPFSEGIILSTGKLVNAQGPNDFISDDGGGMGWAGDYDLNQALGISNSINATVLEFDFIPIGNHISFDYIFASEEYHGTATCTYSDGFAFLLKEVGTTTYQNLALIPNTNIPVKVTSVHPNIPGGCPAQNEQYFDAFNPLEHPTNFNGQTKVLTAKASVTPGTTYHIKLVIADEGNYRYDSAIFLKGSSFNLGVDLGDDRTVTNQNPICPTESITLNATSFGAQTYQWYYNTNPIIGQTASTLTFNPPYTSTQNGTYSVNITYSTTCTITSEINLDFSPVLQTNQTNYTFCDTDNIQDGISAVILTDITPTLFTNLPANFQVSYYSSTTSTSPLPNSFTLTTPFQQTIYVRINNNNCYNNIPITLNIQVFTDTILDETLGICNNSPTILIADSGYTSYLWSTSETTQSIQVSTPNTYTVIIENTNGCTKTKTFTVVGSEIATINEITINDFIDNNSIEIIATGNGNYEYSIDGIHYQTSPVFSNLSGLVYTAYVNDKNGCGIATKEFYLLQIPKYFTPNGDGYNDTWNIKNLSKRGFNQTIISVFDRYGKLLKQFSGNSAGWDGTYNSKNLLADDYWFSISNQDKELFRGHFTLKR